ncbi:MAG: RNA-binding domain-containing protein [Candidatus Njordarchaeia archaeon]
MVKILIRAEVYPTEDVDKVMEALHNIFDIDNREIKISEGYDKKILQIETSDLNVLDKFKSRVKHRNIQTHIRVFLERNAIANKTFIYLNKQVATVKKVSLCDSPHECPMGAITLEIEAGSQDELYRVIDWLTS